MAKADKKSKTKNSPTPKVAKAKTTARSNGATAAAKPRSVTKPTPKTKAAQPKSGASATRNIASTKAAKPKPSARTTTSRKAAKSSPSITTEQFRAVEEDARELPLEYGDTKIVLMPRDPEWVFAYWEISPETRRALGIVKGKHSRPLTLRVHEISNDKEVNVFDVTVNDYTSSWYLRIPSASANYRVELGLQDDKGRFRHIATSNLLALPKLGISDESPAEFAEINDEIYSQIVHLSGGQTISTRLGSDEFLRNLQQRVFQSISSGSLFSGGNSSGGVFSGAGFSGDLFSAPAGEAALRRPITRDREFWLEAGVDVIVYGATVPDAKVKFMGQEVRLTPDGTFRVRMVLPNTTVEFPIEATSADGHDQRAVKPVVTRRTEGDPHLPL